MKYVHVSIDTFSGFLCASLHTGEAARDVIAHFLHCFSVIGTPSAVKSDNGPAYTSHKIQDFLAKFGISLKFGIPHNPQGQGIVERAHATLKNMLSKLSSNDLAFRGHKSTPPPPILNHALFVLNFLSLDQQGKSAADRLWHPSTKDSFSTVLWKDVRTGAWLGPHPVLIWGKGHACVHNPDTNETRWLPDRLVKPFSPPRDPAPEASSPSSFSDSSHQPPQHGSALDPLAPAFAPVS